MPHSFEEQIVAKEQRVLFLVPFFSDNYSISLYEIKLKDNVYDHIIKIRNKVYDDDSGSALPELKKQLFAPFCLFHIHENNRSWIEKLGEKNIPEGARMKFDPNELALFDHHGEKPYKMCDCTLCIYKSEEFCGSKAAGCIYEENIEFSGNPDAEFLKKREDERSCIEFDGTRCYAEVKVKSNVKNRIFVEDILTSTAYRTITELGPFLWTLIIPCHRALKNEVQELISEFIKKAKYRVKNIDIDLIVAPFTETDEDKRKLEWENEVLLSKARNGELSSKKTITLSA